MKISSVVIATALSFAMGTGTMPVSVYAQEKQGKTPLPSPISIANARAHATVPGQPVGAAYMTISSAFPVKLIKVETDAAKEVQIHNTHRHQGIVKMREEKSLQVEADEPLVLAPGGRHMMLLGLKNQLKAGERILLFMKFEDSKKNLITKRIEVPVRPLGEK